MEDYTDRKRFWFVDNDEQARDLIDKGVWPTHIIPSNLNEILMNAINTPKVYLSVEEYEKMFGLKNIRFADSTVRRDRRKK